VHADGMGAFKLVHRQPKGLLHLVPLADELLHLEGDHFRVRRYPVGQGMALLFQVGFEIEVVVDIAIEAGVDDAVDGDIVVVKFVVHRVTVGFTDFTDGSPACMG